MGVPMVRKQVRRRTSLLMGISLALLIGAAAAFFVFALPQHLLERITVLSGLARLMVQAEPPISPNDRILLAILAGIGTTGIGWVLIDWVIFGRAGMSALIRPREDDYEDDDDDYRPSDPLDLVTPAPRAIDLPMPAVNAIDPRRPLSARTDIGDPPRPPVFAPPLPASGDVGRSNGQALPPLDQLFADAARAPAPVPAPAPAPPAPVAPEASAPEAAASGLLDPASLFRGLGGPPSPSQGPAAPLPTPAVQPADRSDIWPPVGAPDPAWPPKVDRPESPVEPLGWPAPISAEPPAPPQAEQPRATSMPEVARGRAAPDLGMESFPPDLSDFPASPYFLASSPPPLAPAAPPAFVPPPESPRPPELTEPEPERTEDRAPADFRPGPADVRTSDMPLEDMLARLEIGMEKRRRALAVLPSHEPRAEAPRRPLPAYAAAPPPLRDVSPPPVEAPPPWTPPVSTESPPLNGDGLLDQPLHVALGVLRNLVRG